MAAGSRSRRRPGLQGRGRGGRQGRRPLLFLRLYKNCSNVNVKRPWFDGWVAWLGGWAMAAGPLHTKLVLEYDSKCRFKLIVQVPN